jgi:transposase
MHSHYTRLLADLPWQGRIVVLQIQARRFRCRQPACPRRIFAERLPVAAEPQQRRTTRLADIQRCIAHGMGGEPGSRLARRLAMPASGDTLLRLIRTTPIETGLPAKIIGIDDWAWCRGRRYGTLIVDLERNRPLDLLPDRQAETVAAWLKAHPGVVIVARDRAGAYAEGVSAGAPAAMQVADRWHLLRNLNETLRGILGSHHRDLVVAAKAAMVSPPAELPIQAVAPQPSGPRPCEGRPGHAARQAVFDEAAALQARGWPQRRIARALNLDRKTLRSWMRLGRPPAWQQPSRGSVVDHHADYLRQRWEEGCCNAARLWREIRAQGFPGQASIVRDWLRPWRVADPTPACPAPAWKTPSMRRAAWLVAADAGKLEETDQRFVAALIAGSAKVARIIELARSFGGMVREKRNEALDSWIAAARSTALAGFANGLTRDLAAVRAALSSPWSTSPVEGQISRLKTIKRTMYGRARLDLLRHRVLAAA